MAKYYVRNILGSLLLLALFHLPQALVGQVEATVTIANETPDGSDYYFDLYLHEEAGSSGPIYLGDSQFRITFNVGSFTSPSLESVSNPGSLFSQEDGWNTLTPTDGSNLFDVAITRNNYYNAFATSIPVEKNNILNIELQGQPTGAFDTRIAKIDDKQLTHRLGRFKITGYKGSGSVDLSVVYGGGFGTDVLTYDPAPPHNLSTVTLNTGTLPVEWVSFTAEEINHQEVKLEWITGAELNNDKFEIEKQLKHGEFQKIGEVASPGNSTNPRVYQFFDSSPMTNVVYYRIKQIDLDGTFEYSNTVEVGFDFNGDEAYTVYPTPAIDEITIEALNNELLTHEYAVVDLQGKEIITGELEAGVAFDKVDVSRLAEGNYFIKIKAPNEEVYHLKFVKK